MFNQITTIVIGVIFIVLLGATGWQTYKLYAAEKTVKAAIEEKKIAEENLAKAIESNKISQEALKMLTTEKADIQAALSALGKSNAKNKITIDAIQKKINDQRADPLNQEGLSPVIKETITSIQESRDVRASEPIP